MPPEDRTKQQIASWWKQHETPIQEMSCPACHADHDWDVDPMAVQIPRYPGTTKDIPHFVRATCGHCGYVVLFDGKIAGID